MYWATCPRDQTDIKTSMLEIACFNPESTLIASEAGADRIELCQSPEVGGTTPDYNALVSIRSRITIPIFVMIRPRGGNFAYSDAEFQQMEDSVQLFKVMADGFVFGVLNANNRVDVERTSKLVNLAHPLPCTFHRAFDEIWDMSAALEDIIKCGLSTILTSGGKSTAHEGALGLAKLVEQAQNRIIIMPGGGVRSTNIEEIGVISKARTFHSSALTDDKNVPSLAEIQQLKGFRWSNR